jgi:integrase/recombinase XerC
MLLKKAVDEFLTHLRIVAMASAYTVKSYREDLSQALAFVREHTGMKSPDLGLWTTRTIRAFVCHLGDKKFAPSSIHRKLSCLRSFGRWARRSELTVDNPATALKGPRMGLTLPYVMTIADVAKLIQTPGDMNAEARRDTAVIATLYGSGVRVAELTALDVEDVELADESLLVKGKGRRERVGVIGPPASEAITAILPDRIQLMKHLGTRANALFLSRSGERITTRSVARLIDKRVMEAGLDPRISPHTLRHSCATHMMNAGCGIKDIQALLGHKKITTTSIYLHVSPARLMAGFAQAHPRA